jgi:2-keto-4-pentenoate hydratase/2-oxohepta-3-ene-1,7-dioic acid hydratase in catechol pathway
MKLLSFSTNGKASFGALVGDGVIDLAKRTKYTSLRGVLAAEALKEVMAAATGAADYKLTDVTLLTPVPDAEKVICIGVNYRAHCIEVGRAFPEQPSVFLRLHSSLVASGEDIVRPTISQDFDYEGELAVVIGKGGHKISRNAALSHVAGYTLLNDGSIRDFQLKARISSRPAVSVP